MLQPEILADAMIDMDDVVPGGEVYLRTGDGASAFSEATARDSSLALIAQSAPPSTAMCSVWPAGPIGARPTSMFPKGRQVGKPSLMNRLRRQQKMP